jgi:hypothetical protein
MTILSRCKDMLDDLWQRLRGCDVRHNGFFSFLVKFINTKIRILFCGSINLLTKFLRLELGTAALQQLMLRVTVASTKPVLLNCEKNCCKTMTSSWSAETKKNFVPCLISALFHI